MDRDGLLGWVKGKATYVFLIHPYLLQFAHRLKALIYGMFDCHPSIVSLQVLQHDLHINSNIPKTLPHYHVYHEAKQCRLSFGFGNNMFVNAFDLIHIAV